MQYVAKLKNSGLQAIRGIAALLVSIGHITARLPRVDDKFLHLVGFLGNWGNEAVMMFFILSGLVIHMSYEKKPVSKIAFIRNRILRIHPTLIIAVTMAALMDVFLFNNKFSLSQFFANIIPVTTLPSYISELYWKTNPVIWSLSFEIFFYVFFALFCIGNKKLSMLAIWIWLILSVISIWLRFTIVFTNPIINHLLLILSFSCVWITGFLIWKYRSVFYCNINLAVFSAFSLPLISRLHILPNYHDPLKYLLFALVSWPVFQYLLDRHKHVDNFGKTRIVIILIPLIYIFSALHLYFDNGYLGYVKILYISFPLVMAGGFYFFRKIFNNGYNTLLPSLSYLGSISYGIYLFHFPVSVFIISLFHLHPLLQIIIILLLTGIVSHFIEFWIQPNIKSLLQKRRKVNYMNLISSFKHS